MENLMTKLSDVKVNDKDYKVISDVTFGTINFKYYKNKWQSEEKIFSTEFFVDKPTYKALGKEFKKMSLKVVENDEMQTRFHLDPVFPDQDEQYKVMMSAKAERTDKKGNLMQLWKEEYLGLDVRPKVYDKATGEYITMKFALQAGCTGDVYFRVHTNEFGTQAYVSFVKLDKVIPYVKPE